MFDRHARVGWRYVRPREPVAMHDNFERAVSEAGGDYVAVVIDKTILHPSALEIAGAALAAKPADIVTWRNEGYDPVDESHDLAVGRYRPTIAASPPALYDPVAELATRFENTERRGLDPVHYSRGKIVFGAFSERCSTASAIGPDASSIRWRPTTPRWCPPASLPTVRSTSAGRCSSRTTL